MSLKEELAEAKQRLTESHPRWSSDIKPQGMGVVTRSVVAKIKVGNLERAGVATVENHLGYNQKPVPTEQGAVEEATDKALLQAINEFLDYASRNL